jgi:hypothetical protein
VVRNRSDAAPRPDPVLLYRAGLPQKKIAELTGAPLSTVSYHLAAAKAADPALKAAQAAAGKSTTQVPGAGLEAHGPGDLDGPSNRTLPVTHGRCCVGTEAGGMAAAPAPDANAGIPDPAVREGLAMLPDWRCRPGHLEREAMWQDPAAHPYRVPGSRTRLAAAEKSGDRRGARVGRVAVRAEVQTGPRQTQYRKGLAVGHRPAGVAGRQEARREPGTST